ncbi:MAG: S8/S53 family peptidase [Candidatus Aenigmatarchaeota archaeon]
MKYALLAAVLAVVLICGCTGQGGQAVSPITYTDADGKSLTTEGYPGYVYLFSDLGADRTAVENAIKAAGGTITDSVPDAGMYLVKVNAGQESTFLSAMYGKDWFLDGSPAFAIGQDDVLLYDIYSGSGTGDSCYAQHGAFTEILAGKLGAPTSHVDFGAMSGFPELIRDAMGKADAAAAAGETKVISISLGPGTTGTITDEDRASGCLSDVCRMVKSERRVFWRMFYQALEAKFRSNPDAANSIMFVMSAGNLGAPLDSEMKYLKTFYPNAYKRIKIVGATDEGGNVYRGFNHVRDNSEGLMAYAQGINVPITTPDGTTTYCHGTSFATPQVAAVLEYIWAMNPDLTSDQVMDAFNKALEQQSNGGILPVDENGEVTQEFLDAAASGKTGGSDIFFTAPSTLTATVNKEFGFQLCTPASAASAATCGGLTPSTNPAGGKPPYSFHVGMSGGFPPTGISLNLNGLLHGTPTITGTYTFPVCARDGFGNENCDDVTIDVRPEEPAEPTEATYRGGFSLSGTYGRPFPEYGTTCMFDDTFSGTITLTITDGSGTAEVAGTFTSNAVSGSVPGFDCLSSSSDMGDITSVSISGSSVEFTTHFYTAGGSDYAGHFSGTLSGDTITGTFIETSTCCSGSASTSVTLARQ